MRKGLSRRGSELLLASVIIARSTSLLLLKLGMADMGAFTLTALRFSTAALLMLLIFHKRVLAAGARVLLKGVAIGAAFFAVISCETATLRLTTTSVTSFLENTSVVLVPLLLALWRRKWPDRVTLASAALSLSGVALLTLGSGLHGFGPGEALGLATALLYACAIIITDRMSHGGGDPLAMGIAQVCTIAALAWAAALIFERPAAIPASGRDWAIILALAVVCTGFGFTLQPVAQRGTSAERAGMFCALSPLSAGTLGAIFLRERLGPSGLLGAALILCGIALPNLLAAARAKREQKSAQ